MLAFGGVADGFVPFDAQTDSSQQGAQKEVELQLASIVMKAVQVNIQCLLFLLFFFFFFFFFVFSSEMTLHLMPQQS